MTQSEPTMVTCSRGGLRLPIIFRTVDYAAATVLPQTLPIAPRGAPALPPPSTGPLLDGE